MITVVSTAILYFNALVELNLPFNKYRKIVIFGSAVVFAAILTIFHEFFFVEFTSIWFLWVSLIVAVAFIVGILFVNYVVGKKMK